MIATRTAVLTMRDGVVVVTVKADVTQSLADAQENYAGVVKLAAGEICPLLIDMRAASPLTPEARHFFASQKMDGTFSALGLLLHASPVGRVLGNVYFRMARHNVPVRMFTEERKAFEWLKASQV